MPSYKITGPRPIAGNQPGTILTAEDLAGCNLDALLQGGHLTPATPTKTTKTTTPEEH